MDAKLLRQRLIVGAFLIVLFLIVSTLDAGSMNMSGMANMPGMLGAANWNFLTALLAFFMWSVMMVAMMVPSASPMVFVFLTANHHRKASGQRLTSVGTFIVDTL